MVQRTATCQTARDESKHRAIVAWCFAAGNQRKRYCMFLAFDKQCHACALLWCCHQTAQKWKDEPTHKEENARPVQWPRESSQLRLKSQTRRVKKPKRARYHRKPSLKQETYAKVERGCLRLVLTYAARAFSLAFLHAASSALVVARGDSVNIAQRCRALPLRLQTGGCVFS